MKVFLFSAAEAAGSLMCSGLRENRVLYHRDGAYHYAVPVFVSPGLVSKERRCVRLGSANVVTFYKSARALVKKV